MKPDSEPLTLTEQALVAAARQIRGLLRSNTLWLTILLTAAAFAAAVDPTWLTAHPWLKTWWPPMLAALGVLVKMAQIQREKAP